MFDLINSQQLKELFKKYGLVMAFGYAASFAFLVFVARRGLVKQGLPGDLLFRFQGEVFLYFPFVSAGALMLALFLLGKLISSFGFSKFFLNK